MAERTAAEVLAMLEDELAKQDAARQLFESDREPRPGPKTVKGIPEAEENLLKAIASPFVPIERDVIREPQSTFETVDRLVPGAMDGEALRQEEVRTSYTPGQYANPRLASPPIVDAISSGLRFGDELLFGTPEQKEAARTTLREGIAGLPGLPQEMIKSMMRGAESVERGGVVTRDAEGNISRPSDYLVGLAGVTAGGTLATGLSSQSATGVVAGLFGGKKAKSGQEAEETVGMIEQQGLTPEEGWARQAGTNRYKAYRSDIDDQVRFEIPMQNAKLAPAKKEMEFPDPRDISKLPQVEQEKLLLDLQGLRTKTVTLPNGEERTRLFIPDVFTLPESTLNKLGFTRLDSASGDFTKFADLTLEQLVDFPELFEEYPQLRTYRVQRMPTMPAALGTRGSFNPETKTFKLADVEATPEGRRDFMSVLMHEIQHAIQEIEGFERGTSVGGVKPIGHDKTKKKLEADLREKEKQLSERLAAIGIDDDFFTVMQNFPDAPLNATNKFFNKLFGPKRKTLGELPKNYQMTDFDKDVYEGLERVKPFRDLRFSVFSYLESRAKEANQKAQGLVTDAEKGRGYKERRIRNAAARAKEQGKSVKEATQKERDRFIGYTGSDLNLIMINRRLKEDFGLPAAQAEKFTEQISSAFDDVIPELRPLMMKQAQIKQIDSSLFGIYQAAPGEVEARNVGLRAMGVKKGQVIDPEQDANPVQLPGESIVKARSRARAERDYSPEELELMFPGETQKMVTPVGGFKKFEGSPKDLTPGERLSMSQRTPRELEKLLLDKRLSLIKSLNEDSFGTTPAEVARNRKRVDREIRDLERRILELRQDPSYAQGGAVQKYANGGMVNNMRKPVLSRGLSGLLSNYTSGPLARMSVPRGTPQGMFRGGAPGMRGVGFRGPQRIPDIDVDQSAISAALANMPPPPTAQTNVAIQSPAERLATRTAVTPVAQALTGARPTDFLGFETTEGAAEMGATAPGQTPFEPGVLITDPTGPTAEEIAAEQAAEEAAAQAAAEQLAAEQLAAEQAAAEQAAAEQAAAEQLAAQQLAAETLAAEQAAAEQAAAEQAAAEQLAAEQLAAQEAAEAARQQELLAQQEAQRIAQEQFDAQIAAEQAAAQQTAAEVLAQEQAAAQAAQTQTQEARVESASDKISEANQKQAVADVANQNLSEATNQGADSATIETLSLDATLKQQDADAAALEAELAVAADPTPIYEAPTQGELLQAAADTDTGPLFTTPTDLGTVIPRSTLGLVPQTTGIMSFLSQPNFNVSDAITDYTSGYPSSQEMQFRRTFYPFQQVTEEEAQNQYMADIFKPVADMSQFRPALTFGERAQTTATGSGVGFQEDVPVGNVNTGAAASAPGQYGLAANQMYQCPEGYTLAFVNGRATCKSTKTAGGPGGRKDVPPEVITLGEGRG